MFDANLAIENIVNGLRASNPSGKAIIGISGGKDSTVVAYLAVKAYGKENVVGVMMPNGEQKDIADSKRVCELLGIKNLTINIGDAYKSLTGAICVNLMDDVSNGVLNNEIPSQYSTNTPARLRMTTLYGVAAILGGRVLNTCNRSEDVLGYSTFYGDSAGSYGPICDYTVSEVRQIGLALGAPEDLVMKAPDDGMCGSTDEQNLSKQLDIPNFTYERLDHLIRREIDECDFSFNEIERIRNLYNKMKFKIEIIRMPHPDSGMVDYFKEL